MMIIPASAMLNNVVPVHAASPTLPSGIIHYIGLNVDNTQNVTTPAPFQQMINITSSSGVWGYINQGSGTWGQNVEFFYANGTIIPSWLESYSSSQAIWWIKLATEIPASSSVTIYIGFASTSTNLFSLTNNVGEAPQLSTTYGEYDNGASVFIYYKVAPSSTSGWTVSGTAGVTTSAPSGSHYGTANAFYANSSPNDYLYTSIPELGKNEIISFNVYTTGLGDLFFLVNSSGAGQMARLDGRSGSLDNGLATTSSWIVYSSPPNSLLLEPPNTWYKYDVVIAGSTAYAYIGSVSNLLGTLGSYANSLPVSYNGNYLGLVGDGLGSSYITYWNSIIIRAYPPNGVMPTVTIEQSPITFSWSVVDGGSGYQPPTVTGTSGGASLTSYKFEINITNSQTVATPAPFQQMLNITSSSAMWSYIDQASGQFGQNLEFTYPNGTIIPSWLESYSLTHTPAYGIWWIKLNAGISASSKITIYAVVAPTSTNFFNTINVGEAPQLSSTYAEYDDGASIFLYYWNFAGTSLPSGWTSSGMSVTVNNGVVAQASTSGTWGATYYNTQLNPETDVLDAYAYFTGLVGNSGGAEQTIGWGPYSSNIQYLLGDAQSTTEYSLATYNGAGSNTLISGGSTSAYQVWSVGSAGTSYAYLTLNYKTTVTTTTDYTPTTTDYVSFNSMTNSYYIKIQWLRVRAYPPNGVMPTVSIASSGTAVSGVPLASQSGATIYLDSSTTWSITNPLTGSGSSERWETPSATSGTVSSTASYSFVYYNQFYVPVSYSIADGGSGYTAPTLTYYSFGTQTQYTLTTTATSFWIDANSWSVTNPLAGSGTSERWETPAPSGTVSSTSAIAPVYYNQYYISTYYSVLDGGTGYSAPVLTYYYLSSKNTYTETTTSSSLWADANSWSITNPLAGSSQTERWETPTASGTVTGAITINPTYYNQYNYSLSYVIEGGGTPTAPVLTSTQFGSSYNPSLTGTKTTYWVDSGSSYSITNPLSPSSSTMRWYEGTFSATGTVSSAENYVLYYYHQYEINNTAFSVTYNYLGNRQVSSATSLWADNGTITLTGIYQHSYQLYYPLNLYQQEYGIQILSNVTLSSLSFSQSSLETSFTTHSASQILIDSLQSGLSINTVLDNGISIAFSENNGIYSFKASSPIVVEYTSSGVTSVGQNSVTQYEFERHSFYSLGYNWIFYSNGTGLEYSYSSSGITFNTTQTQFPVTSSTMFSVTNYGSNVMLVYSTSSGLYYSYGTLEANGIKWDTSPITVLSSATINPGITYSGGYLYITYTETGTTDYLYITDSNSISSIATTSGFPYEITSGTYSFSSSPVPVNNGVSAVYSSSNNLYIKSYVSGAWTTAVEVPKSYLSQPWEFSVVSEPSNVYVTWLNDTKSMYFASYSVSQNSFQTPLLVNNVVGYPSATISEVSDNVYISYVYSGALYYNVWNYQKNLIQPQQEIVSDSGAIANTTSSFFTSNQYAQIGILYTSTNPVSYTIKFSSIYSSVNLSIILFPDKYSTSVNSNNYFTVNYIYQGSENSIKYTGSEITITANAGSAVTISSTSSSSSSSIEWIFDNKITSPSITANTGVYSFYYYTVIPENISYSIIGSQSTIEPTATFIEPPSSASAVDNSTQVTITMSQSGTEILPVITTTVSATHSISGVSGERWITPNYVFVMNSHINMNILYYQQYEFNIKYSLSGGGQYGSPTFYYKSMGTVYNINLTSIYQNLWVDASSNWSASSQLPDSTSSNAARTQVDTGTINTENENIAVSYFNQFYVPVSYSISDSAATNSPTLNISQFGTINQITMTSYQKSYWIDAGSTWSAESPFLSQPDLLEWYASPKAGYVYPTGVVTSSSPITIYYSQTQVSSSGNPLTALSIGNLIPAVVFVFSSVIGLQLFVGFIISMILVAIYLQTENTWAPLVTYLILGSVFITLMPTYLLQLGIVFVVLGIAGIITKLFMRR